MMPFIDQIKVQAADVSMHKNNTTWLMIWICHKEDIW